MGIAVLAGLRLFDWFGAQVPGGNADGGAAAKLDVARRLADEGKSSEARALLDPIVARVDDPSVPPSAFLLKAQIETSSGDTAAAMATLKLALERYPSSPEQPELALKYAGMLEDSGQFEAAAKLYTDLRESAPPAYRTGAVAGLGRQAEREGKRDLARDLFRLSLKDAVWGSEEWTEAAENLGRLNIAAIFGPAPTPDSKVYRVEAGDNLTAIGMKLNTTQGLLVRANGITESTSLRIGQNIKYTPKDFAIVIERSTLRLFLMDTDGLFKIYKVGLGKPGQETALGRYRIGNKEKDPTWHKPGAGPIPPGDPRNELGTRWMPMIPDEEGLPDDLGIHGTIAPETVGQYTSMGCPRLIPADVEELYDLVVRSTPVTVVEKYDPNVTL